MINNERQYFHILQPVTDKKREHKDRETDKLTDRQTDRQTDREGKRDRQRKREGGIPLRLMNCHFRKLSSFTIIISQGLSYFIRWPVFYFWPVGSSFPVVAVLHSFVLFGFVFCLLVCMPAQVVERRTNKQKQKHQAQYWRWFTSQMRQGKGFSPSQLQCRSTLLGYIHTAPVCSRMHQLLCARYRPQTLAAIPLLGHTKTLRTLIGMGSVVLTAALPYPGTASRISRKGQRCN